MYRPHVEEGRRYVRSTGNFSGRSILEKIENLERPFTPRGWLRSAWNFGKTRFGWFVVFHFSTLKIFFGKICEKKIGVRFFFKKVRFWRSYDFLIRVGRCVVKSYCPNCPYFWGDFLGEGVNDSIYVEYLDLALKLTSTIWCCDLMRFWNYDT